MFSADPFSFQRVDDRLRNIRNSNPLDPALVRARSDRFPARGAWLNRLCGRDDQAATGLGTIQSKRGIRGN